MMNLDLWTCGTIVAKTLNFPFFNPNQGNGGTRLIIWETLNLLFGKCLNLVSQLKKGGLN